MTTRSPAPRPSPPTLKDVAALAGVSPALASMALRGVDGPSEKTRRRVLDAAESLQYQSNAAASLLARDRPRLIGVTCFLDRDLDADIVDHLYAEAARVGYELIIGATTPSHALENSLRMLAANSCEAIIAVGPKDSEAALSRISSRTPVVIIGAFSSPQHEFNTVHIDDRRAMELAVGHLVKLGHTEIHHLSGGTGYSSYERRTGYESAMQHAGLADCIRVVEGGQTEEAGAAAARNLLAEDAPTAIVTYNDASAIGAMTEARKIGYSIPEDLSVVGCDNSRASRIAYVDLTTVSQDREDLARHAMRGAMALMREPNSPREDYKSTPHLVARSTTAPPRARQEGCG